MAAFSRGSTLAASCCSSSFRLATQSSFILPRFSFIQSCALQRPFSISAPLGKAKVSQRLSKAAIAHKVKQLKQEVEDRKIAEQRAEKIRTERQAHLKTTEETEEEHSVDIRSESTSTTTLPLNEYNPRLIKQKAWQPDDLVENEANRHLARGVTEIMSHGEEVVIYKSPNRRWHLGLACAITGSVGFLLWLGSLASFEPFIYDSKLFAGVMLLISLFLAWPMMQAVSKRARMVRGITLVPKTYNNTRIIELRIEGSGWLPFTRKTVQSPLWEIKVNKPVSEVELPTPVRDTDLREHYSLLQPFHWLWNTVKGVSRETNQMVLLPPSRAPLVRLYTEEGNTAPLTCWWLDARGKFWRDAEGMFCVFYFPS
jgi:hypothetical protein